MTARPTTASTARTGVPMRSSATITAAPRDPSIPAAIMLGSLALVIGRAEIRYRWGASAEAAITEALRDHPASLAIETACRVAWRMMTAPDDEHPDVRRLHHGRP